MVALPRACMEHLLEGGLLMEVLEVASCPLLHPLVLAMALRVALLTLQAGRPAEEGRCQGAAGSEPAQSELLEAVSAQLVAPALAPALAPVVG